MRDRVQKKARDAQIEKENRQRSVERIKAALDAENKRYEGNRAKVDLDRKDIE